MNNIKVRKQFLDLFAYTILILGSLLMIGPFAWMIATSLKQPADQFTRTLIPNPATLDNFQQLWTLLPFSSLIWNSLKIALVTTIGQLLTCSMGAFVFAVV